VENSKKVWIKPPVFIGIMVLTALAWALLVLMTFFLVPSDRAQGVIQRIFYYHVPTAWISFIGFFLSFIGSVLYLKTRNLKYDSFAAANAVAGWIFTTGVLITGPLWAKPIWGDFWNWSDQRLVSFFILWMSFASYILLRIGVEDPHKRARFSAILDILATMDLPLVIFAIKIWVTPSHPQPVVGKGIFDARMGYTLILGVVAFQLLYIVLTLLYYRYLEQQKMILQGSESGE